MKRALGFLVVFGICLSMIHFCAFAAVSSNEPNRVINVVYDDSLSMVRNGPNYVDTWCKAKYSMEVFAALMGRNDILNIYYMSDFDQGANGSAKISLRGSDSVNDNVSKVHSLLSPSDTSRMNTPFKAVEKAYQDLLAVNAEGANVEKWLVVLTDGAFETNVRDQKKDPNEVNAFFASTDSSIDVMFLSIGSGGANVNAGNNGHFYFKTASSSDEILQKITEICQQVFNSHSLNMKSSGTFSFDIPMSQLIVFAQGQNVVIGGVSNKKGEELSGAAGETSVKYSTIPYEGCTDSNVIVDEHLMGKVKVYTGNYSAGDYSVDIKDAETAEVYYKPNVQIGMFLTSSDGKEVTELEKLEAGKYKLDFGLIDPNTKKRLPESSLLGDITYNAVISNNGTVLEGTLKPGDIIELKEGNIKVEAIAHYLDYNSVKTEMNYKVWKNKTITFESVGSTSYSLTADGLQVSEPFQIKVQVDGEDVTEQQWNEMQIPTVTRKKRTSGEYGEISVEKSSLPGVYNIYPSIKGKKPHGKQYGDLDYVVEYSEIHGDEVWSGSGEGTIPVMDTRTWIARHRNALIFGVISGCIFLLVLGYVPGVKKYLPKRLKNRPRIECDPTSLYGRPYTAHGRVNKELIYSLLPYFSERATMKYVPPGVPKASVLKMKAAGRNYYYVMNPKSFAGKDYIQFGGTAIEKDSQKPFKLSAGTEIKVYTDDMVYTCIPTEK